MKPTIALTGAIVILLAAGGCSDDLLGPDRRAVEQAAARAQACGGGSLFEVFYTEPAPEFEQCAMRHDRCGDMFACAGFDVGRACEGIAAAHCKDNVAFSCAGVMQGAELSSRFVSTSCDDDPNGNDVCLPVLDYDAQCGVEHCGKLSASCDGNVLVKCDRKVRFQRDCEREGLICTGDGSDAGCTLPVKCKGDGCDGDDVIDCADSGHAVRIIHCAEMDPRLTCGVTDGQAHCQPRDEPPQCSSNETRCEENVLRTCVGGFWREVDCGLLPSGRCTRLEGDQRISQCTGDLW